MSTILLLLFIFGPGVFGLGLLTVGLCLWKKVPALSRILCSFAPPALWWSLFIPGFLTSYANPLFFQLYLAGITAAALIGLILIWKPWKSRVGKIILLAVCVLYVASFGYLIGEALYDRYVDSIPTLGESDTVLDDYNPAFPENKCVSIPNPDFSFAITDSLPSLDGATALYPVYASFAKTTYPAGALELEYQHEHLACSTTAGAYDAIIYGYADIIFVSGASDKQIAKAKEQGIELEFTPLGHEGFVFFVNSQNPLENISSENLKKIYAGKLTRWNELGVETLGKIRAFQREEGSGSQTRLQRFMDGTPLMQAPKEDVQVGMGGIVNKVADYRNFKNAIGFSFRFYVTEMLKNDEIKLLSIDGITPSKETIADGSYPLTGTFYAVTRKTETKKWQPFLNWMRSPEGQQILDTVGYVPLQTE